MIVSADCFPDSLLPLEDVLAAVSGIVCDTCLDTSSFFFISVVTDSRQVVCGSLFIPLQGTMQDGHIYIPQALERGASVVFCAETHFAANHGLYVDYAVKYPSVIFISVENTLVALQSLAKRYISQFPHLKKIGITGSSGKTTTKELCAAVLSQRFRVVMNEGNLNSETGLPLSVFNVRAYHEIGIFEMGMNRKGEINELANVLCPDYGVITNIGSAHIGILGSKDAIAAEKKGIFSYFSGAQTAIIPDFDEYTEFLSRDVNGSVVYFGVAGSLPIFDIREMGLEGTSFSYKGFEIHVPLPGRYNLYNALAAVAVAQCFNLSPQEIKMGLENIKPLFGRSQILYSNVTIIQDCYNANPDSMNKALDMFSSLPATYSKIAILGDMLELGKDSQQAHQAVIRQALSDKIDILILIGNEMSAAANVYSSSCKIPLYVFEHDLSVSLQSIVQLCNDLIHAGDIVLLKGSRGMALERLTPYLREIND